MGYKKIFDYLNEKGIKTPKGNFWRGNNVHSVLKRHKKREDRLKFVNKEYEPKCSKIEVMWKSSI